MARPSDCSSVVSCRSRRFGALVALLGLFWLWVGSLPAMAPAHRAADRAATAEHPSGLAGFESAASTAVETALRDEGMDRLESSDDDGGAANANEASESGPDVDLWDRTGSVRTALGDGARLRRRFDPFVGQCCVRQSTTRGPPARNALAA